MEPDIKQLLELVHKRDKNIANTLAVELGVSRQAASARLRKAVKDGLITKSGVGRGVSYKLRKLNEFSKKFKRQGLSEDRVWASVLFPVVADLPQNIRDIWQYGFTEMVNNAIDHSESKEILVEGFRTGLYTEVWVEDRGVGIFNKIQKALDLFDPREAILELAKGKFTTDPQNHSGEGIFFSSKVFDEFDILSGNLVFLHESDETDDWLIDNPKHEIKGTHVMMRLINDCKRTTKEIFDKFAAPEEYTFAKTIVPVKLARHEGEKLVSRSQAKRLIFRFEKFKTVILDFGEVEEIGQAFADEVFRVFQKAHRDTKLVPVNMSQAVKDMVMRAKAG